MVDPTLPLEEFPIVTIIDYNRTYNSNILDITIKSVFTNFRLIVYIKDISNFTKRFTKISVPKIVI
jgi:hypothetical protein